MTFLILSVVCSTLIGFIFKGFEHYKVNTLQAIVFNYFVCVSCASVSLGYIPFNQEGLSQPWFPYALVLGFIFISAFNAAAFTIQKFGITIGAIMQKMSIIISVTFAIILYKEPLNALKFIGLLLAVVAIILTNIPNKNNPKSIEKKSPLSWFLLLYTLVAAGILEIILQYVELYVSAESGDLGFIAFVFGTAGSLGLIVLIVQAIIGSLKLEKKNLLAGIILGVPNFFSIYFLMKAIGLGWGGSVIFPINNVAIIVLSSGLAYLILKEKLSTINILGVVMASASIALIASA